MTGKKVISMVKPVLTEALITVLALLLLAFLMLRQGWENEMLKRCVFAVYGLACLLGGCQAGRAASRRKYLWGMGYGVIYFLLLCLLSLAAGNGAQAEMSKVWQILAVCGAGGMVGGMISLIFER